jgi:hypothetical protein
VIEILNDNRVIKSGIFKKIFGAADGGGNVIKIVRAFAKSVKTCSVSASKWRNGAFSLLPDSFRPFLPLPLKNYNQFLL